MSHVKDQANRFSVGQVKLRNIVAFMVVFKIYIRYEISIVFISICIYNISMSMFIEVYSDYVIFMFMFVYIYTYIYTRNV